MLLLCLLLVLVAFGLSLPLTWTLIGVGRRLGQVDVPDAEGSGGRKAHGRIVPNTGGIAIFWAIAIPLIGILAAVWLAPESMWSGSLAKVTPHLEGLQQQTPMAVAVLVALAVMHILGLIDDRKRLGPYSKLIVQLLVCGSLAGFFGMRLFEFLGVVPSIILSVIWMVLIANAMNFLDNMDGLSGGVGAICAALYLAATLINGQWFVAAFCALLLGALLGFLVFNVPPAKVFMGDGGSLVLGLLLAIISIRTTYVELPASGLLSDVRWYGMLMPVMVLAVPLYDFTSVTLIRLSRGQSPFVGDRNHFSHRLVRRGLSQRAAVVVVWCCTLATGLSGVMLSSLEGWQAALAAAQSAAVLLVLALLERSGGIE